MKVTNSPPSNAEMSIAITAHPQYVFMAYIGLQYFTSAIFHKFWFHMRQSCLTFDSSERLRKIICVDTL